VEQTYYEVDRHHKVELLTRLIDIHDLKLGIIFCNTKRMVDDLVDHLNAQGYSADRLHGDMSQVLRDRVMNKFRKSGLEFLVATDIAARGIDVEDLQVVFNYDLPYDGEDYVHRIGRTGRAGRSGRAISFASGRELFQIRNIERYTNTRIHRAKPPTLQEVEEARENVFLARLRATLQSGEFKPQDHLVEHLLEEGFTSTDIISALLHHLQSGAPAPPQREEPHDQRPAGRAKPSTAAQPRHPLQKRFEQGASRNRGASPKGSPRPPPRLPADRPTVTSPTAHGPTAHGPTAHRPATPRPTAPKAKSEEPDYARLHLNLGTEMGVGAADVVEAILGETGLPPKIVGPVDVRERHVFVSVQADYARSILAKLNRAEIKGQRLKAKVA